MEEDLFKKSIGAEQIDQQLYSIRSMFWVAFFGGPVAIAIYTLLNSAELKRIAKDSGPAVVLCLAYLAVLIFATTSLSEMEAASLEGLNLPRIMRWIMRILALAYLAIYYFRLRGIYRAYEHAGNDYRNPWTPAIASLLVAVAVTVVPSSLFNV